MNALSPKASPMSSPQAQGAGASQSERAAMGLLGEALASPPPSEPVGLTARICRCERPLQDEDTCFRCGRSVPVRGVSEPDASERPPGRTDWTRAGVVRAINTFTFFRSRPPTPADWTEARTGWPSLATVDSLFGSFPAALGRAAVAA